IWSETPGHAPDLQGRAKAERVFFSSLIHVYSLNLKRDRQGKPGRHRSSVKSRRFLLGHILNESNRFLAESESDRFLNGYFFLTSYCADHDSNYDDSISVVGNLSIRQFACDVSLSIREPLVPSSLHISVGHSWLLCPYIKRISLRS